MELCEFREDIYGKHNSRLYKFESAWDAFRPIDGIAWDGRRLIELDRRFKTNLLSDYYGYESLEMKRFCNQIIRDVHFEKAIPITDIVHFWKWAGQSNVEWWRDRPCIFASKCVPRTIEGWKMYLTYLRSKPKTLRHSLASRLTRKRRLLPN